MAEDSGLKKLGAAAVLDQGLFTGANFVLSVLLARWLSPAQYGAFAIAFTVVLFLRTAHTALIVEPMLVYGPNGRFGGFPDYLGRVVAGNFVLVGLLAGVGCTAALFVRELLSHEVGNAILVASATLPATFCLVLLRYAYYASYRPGYSAASSLVYLLVLVPGLFLLKANSVLTVETAFLVQAIAGVAGVAALAWRLSIRWSSARSWRDGRSTLAAHKPFGQWLWGSLMTNWVATEVWYLLLPPIVGVAASGVLRAHMNLFKPVDQMSIALSAMVLPIFSRSSTATNRTDNLRHAVVPVLIICVVAAVATVLFGSAAMRILYDQQYAPMPELILVVGFLSILIPIGRLYGVAAKSTGRARSLFLADVITAGFAIVAGLLLIPAYGWRGLAVAMCCTNLLWLFLCRQASRTEQSNPR